MVSMKLYLPNINTIKQVALEKSIIYFPLHIYQENDLAPSDHVFLKIFMI